jgi:hypothetical protein
VQARAALVQRGKGRPSAIIDVYVLSTAHEAGGARRTEACTGGRPLAVRVFGRIRHMFLHCIHDVLVNAVGACKFGGVSVHVFSEDIPKKGVSFREALPG